MNTAYLICLAVTGLSIFPRAENVCDHAQVIVEEAEKNDLEASLLVSLIAVESNWNPTVESWAGACGLTQVLPKHTKKYSGKDRNLTCAELKDPATSIKIGSRILNYWIYSYAKGKYKTALCGYNAGFRCKGNDINATGVRYANKVLSYKRRLDRAIKRIQNEEDKHAKNCNRLFLRVGSFCF